MKGGCSTPFQKRNKLRVRIPITHRLATTRPCRIPDRHNHFAFSWPGCPAVGSWFWPSHSLKRNGGHLQTFCQQVSARGETKGTDRDLRYGRAEPPISRARARSRRLSA